MTASPAFRHGAGRLSLDFIRTLRYRGRPEAVEELPDAGALAAWINEFGPCRLTVEPSRTQVTDAQRLREAIHKLLAGIRDDETPPVSARSRVNHAAALPVPTPRIDARGELSWQADDPTSATLALVARDALDLATSDAMGKLRNCANPDCGILFLDNSRPGNRRWCSMDTCGNQAKKATLRLKAGA